ncbi:MBL fold metallo-hydrolase [Candidatus Peregrinibacteria bacterium]|nr:MBL fold metallo-hydrolase [Candidatus Peregrinibacteria bacterium]MBT7484554.1 MBL fold metallo-hydrolase [Candidatus Peregrinibacteria bacterium]
MKLTSHGAAGGVTGSKHLLEVNGKRILLDCGMFQGRRKEAKELNHKFPFDPKSIDVVVLSHAHIDHSGSLPRLVKLGYDGPIFTTFATRDFCNYMLLDSAYIQEREAEYINKKKLKKGEPMVEPEYTQEDVIEALHQFHGIGYKRAYHIAPGVKVTLYEAGHILGSAVVYLEIDDEEDGQHKTILFSGDLGRRGLPILKNPYQVEKADYYITECTYGNRFHEAITDVDNKVADIVNRTVQKGGKLIIPAFSLGRTQEIVYTLHHLFAKNRIPHDLPIIVDSPLSGNVTEVFKAHVMDFDEEARNEFLRNQENPFGFGRLHYTRNVEESKALNNSRVPMIIISASGMCEHGRILHHLRNNLDDPKNGVLIVGYMAQHTLGRKLVEGQKEVNIFGEPHQVRAEINIIDAFSAHADRSDLLDYAVKIKGLKKVFLVHGEEEQALSFKESLAENGITNVEIPQPQQTFTL